MKKSVNIDLGLSSAAIGDFDGDQWNILMLNEEQGKVISSTLKSSAGKKAFLTADAVYKMKSEIFAEEAKGGIGALKKVGIGQDITFAGGERIAQDVLKESAAKELVGSLDTQLGRMRAAILDLEYSTPGMADKAEEALALLKAVEEHAVIKGKKLEVYRPFAENITKAMKSALNDGDNLAALQHVFESEIFRGSALLDEGIQITGSSIGQGSPEHVQAAVQQMRTEKLQLASAMETMRSAATRHIAAPGGGEYSSYRQLSAGMGGGPEAAEKAFQILNSMRTFQAGIIGEYSGDHARSMIAGAGGVVNAVQSTFARMNKSTMGLAAMGIAGSMATLGVISGQGYAAEPLTVEGEVIPNQVQNAIAASRVMQRPDHGPSPQQLSPIGNQYGMMDRTINPRTTYMRPPNSYQIRGQISSESGMGQINSFMHRLSGNGIGGSVRINDTRRPITQNYVDRLLDT
jgi:hypothetical protein